MRFVEIVEPDDGDTFEMKVRNSFNSLLKENKGKHIVELKMFLNSVHIDAFTDEKNYVEEAIKTIFKNKIPASSIIYTPISNGREFAIQYQIYDGNSEIEYKTLLAHHYVTAKSKTGTELFSGGISFNEDSLLFAAQHCFDFAEQILMAEDMNFGHIYRQWNYIPSVKQSTNHKHVNNDEVSIFNEIKDFYYEDALFTNGKPISSNIHHFNHTLQIDFIAFAGNVNNCKTDKQDISWLNNLSDFKVKCPNNGSSELWFSSINKEAAAEFDSQNMQLPEQDIEKQTLQILKNIVELIKTCQTRLNSEAALIFLEVSVKLGQDDKKVEELIKNSLPQIQTLFVNCTPNNTVSLVEIEGLIR